MSISMTPLVVKNGDTSWSASEGGYYEGIGKYYIKRNKIIFSGKYTVVEYVGPKNENLMRFSDTIKIVGSEYRINKYRLNKTTYSHIKANWFPNF